MGGLRHFWEQGDLITRGVAVLLLAMSVSAWVLIVWKGWLLRRARADIARRAGLLGCAHDGRGQRQLAFDREGVPAPAARRAATASAARGTLESRGQRASQLTRRLRDALHARCWRSCSSAVLLASVGSTAPFIGLFGTVWGIYHALLAISAAGAITIDKVSGPVGEALVMTAAGLAVAIPAVLAYNVSARSSGRLRGRARRFRARPARDDHRLAEPGVGTADAMAFGRLERSPARSR